MINMIKRVEIWGDSVLKGVIYDTNRKKYRRLENSHAMEKITRLGLDIRNNSKFGMTAPKAKNLMLNALEKGIDAEAAIIEFGGNDCDFKWAEVAEQPDKEHTPNTPLSVFKECITEMVNALRRKGIKPILVNLPPIHSGKYFKWISRGLDAGAILRWLGDKELIYRHHESYSLAVVSLAQSLSCNFIDVRLPFLLKRDYCDYLCEDGIHPNERGHELINQTFEDYAKSLIHKLN
ncbi:MAG: SGNH/GDSL hydrolase family protein [Clostridiaceae bacterium]|jgi:acyl-CoA thioesterase-1|nr:SGNH/GDSL hydrolase family protein [Clostridiaceae bacterium]